MIRTRSQEYAERAYHQVDQRRGEGAKEYLTVARAFPTLLHTCGLAQALAFAAAKKGAHERVLRDLAAVLPWASVEELLRESRRCELFDYQRLSREARAAATWLKRYAEALLAGGTPSTTTLGGGNASQPG